MSSYIFGYALIESPSLNLGTKNDRASQNRYNESQNRNPNPKPLCTTKTVIILIYYMISVKNQYINLDKYLENMLIKICCYIFKSFMYIARV